MMAAATARTAREVLEETDDSVVVRLPNGKMTIPRARIAEVLTVHAEACPHLHRNLQQIRDLGVCPGASLNPSTPVSAVEYVLEELDLVPEDVVMTVGAAGGVLQGMDTSSTYTPSKSLLAPSPVSNENTICTVSPTWLVSILKPSQSPSAKGSSHETIGYSLTHFWARSTMSLLSR